VEPQADEHSGVGVAFTHHRFLYHKEGRSRRIANLITG
jgi:hypothetical protein